MEHGERGDRCVRATEEGERHRSGRWTVLEPEDVWTTLAEACQTLGGVRVTNDLQGEQDAQTEPPRTKQVQAAGPGFFAEGSWPAR